VIGLCCHRRFALPAKLDTSVEASGPHDFAVRISAVRQQHLNVHRIPCPTSVTIAIRPSVRDGMAGLLELIWAGGKAEYFCGRGWTEPKSHIEPWGLHVGLQRSCAPCN
jgi:hypothetical protein